MATLVAANLEPALARGWARLLPALALSVVLHLMLALGIPVNPTGGVPSATPVITARLEAVKGEGPAEVVSELQVPNAPVDSDPVKIRSVDALADPADKKPAPETPKAAAAPPPVPGSGIELPLIRDPTYYPTSQLDVFPRPLTQIDPPYPDNAFADRIEGNVLLLLLIDEIGVVTEVSVVEADPTGYFEDAASSAFRATRFAPGMRQGHAVKSRIQFRVRFTYDKSMDAAR